MNKTIEELRKTDKEFLTAGEVAEVMGMDRKTVYKYAESLPFRTVKMGRKLLIPKRAFIEYVLKTR